MDLDQQPANFMHMQTRVLSPDKTNETPCNSTINDDKASSPLQSNWSSGRTATAPNLLGSVLSLTLPTGDLPLSSAVPPFGANQNKDGSSPPRILQKAIVQPLAVLPTAGQLEVNRETTSTEPARLQKSRIECTKCNTRFRPPKTTDIAFGRPVRRPRPLLLL